MGANKIDKHYVQIEIQRLDVTAESNRRLLGNTSMYAYGTLIAMGVSVLGILTNPNVSP